MSTTKPIIGCLLELGRQGGQMLGEVPVPQQGGLLDGLWSGQHRQDTTVTRWPCSASRLGPAHSIGEPGDWSCGSAFDRDQWFDAQHQDSSPARLAASSLSASARSLSVTPWLAISAARSRSLLAGPDGSVTIPPVWRLRRTVVMKVLILRCSRLFRSLFLPWLL